MSNYITNAFLRNKICAYTATTLLNQVVAFYRNPTLDYLKNNPVLNGYTTETDDELIKIPAVALQYTRFFSVRPTVKGSLGKDTHGNMSAFWELRTEWKGNQLGYGGTKKHVGSMPYAMLKEFSHITLTTSRIYKVKYSEYNIQDVTEDIYNIILIDCDDWQEDFYKFERYGITPSYFIANPRKPKSLQIGFILSEPIFIRRNENYSDLPEYMAKEAEKTAEIFKKTKQILNDILNGDPNYNGHNAKNPFRNTEQGKVFWLTKNFGNVIEKNNLSTLYNIVLNAYERYRDDLEGKYEEKIANERKAEYKDQNAPFNIKLDNPKEWINNTITKNPNYIFDENSRNCSLYSECRAKILEVSSDFQDTNDEKAFVTYVTNVVLNTEREHKYDLPKAELKAMIKDLAKRLWKLKTVQKYPAHQQRRLRKKMEIKTQIKNRFGVKARYSKAEKNEMLRLYDISEKTLERYIAELRKEKTEKPTDNLDKECRQIHALREGGIPWEEIAELFKKNQSTVKVAYMRWKEKNKIGM